MGAQVVQQLCKRSLAIADWAEGTREILENDEPKKKKKSLKILVVKKVLGFIFLTLDDFSLFA